MKTMKQISMMILAASALVACQNSPSPRQPAGMVGAEATGGNSGGGGKGVLCGEKLRTLDLYEAEVVNHGTLIADAGDLKKNMETLSPLIGHHFGAKKSRLNAGENEKQIDGLITKKFKFLPQGQRLELTKDATLPKLGEGCREVQIAIYRSDDSIDVDREYWERLSPLDQSALVMHEFVYYIARAFSAAVDSDESRKVIGDIFTGKEVLTLVDDKVNEAKHMACWPETLKFPREDIQLVIGDETQQGIAGIGIYFKVLKGHVVITRTNAFVPGYTVEQVMKGVPRLATIAYNSTTGGKWNVEFETSASGEISVRAWAPGQPVPLVTTEPCHFE